MTKETRSAKTEADNAPTTAMKTLLGLLLALSLALNGFLWSRLTSHSTAPQPQAAADAEIEELRRQNQELEARRKAAVDSAEADALELARLRNEVGRLRQEAAAIPELRLQAEHAAKLFDLLTAARVQLAKARHELDQVSRSEEEAKRTMKMVELNSHLTPDGWKSLKEFAASNQCAGNLKQVMLAARLWAVDHQQVFPPGFLSMKDELGSPKVLFCPSNPATTPVRDWSQVNPSQISYPFLIPNSPVDGPLRQAFTCPIHGHVAMSDGSVRRK